MSWHSMYSYHGHWTDDRHGPWRKSYQNFRIGIVIPSTATMHRRLQKTRPSESKGLPVEAEVPEYLIECVLDPSASELKKAVGDLSLTTFYYLLRVGEYTVKGKKDNSKQTVKFKMEDVRFFAKDKRGCL
jgi:hypothetical protein